MLVSSELAQMMSQYVKCGKTMELNIVFDKSIVRKGFTRRRIPILLDIFLEIFSTWVCQFKLISM